MTEKRIRVRLDAGNTKSDIRGINGEMKGLGRTSDNVSKGFTKLKGVFVAVSAALATGAITRYSDAWTRLNNQIKQTTNTTQNALAVQEAILQIARSSRVDIEGVAGAYQRISNSIAEYGFSAKDTLDVVEGLTKAFKSNGATAQEVSSVLVQLGQGLGSGALQGEELRAILEASLPVSRAIAKEFGVTVGQLKNLGAEGKLTTERVFRALQNSLPEFESAFDKASVTIAEGIQVTENSVTRLIGEINDATGAGDEFAKGLIDLSSSVDFLSDAVASGAAGKIAEVFQDQLRLVGNDVSKTADYIAKLWSDLGNEITSDTQASTLDIGDAFLNIVPNVRTLVKVITVEIANAVGKLGAYGEAVAATLNPFDDVSVDQARGAFKRQIAGLDDVRKAALQFIFDQREAEKTAQSEKIAEAEALIEKYNEQREARKLTLGNISAGTGSVGKSDGDSGGVDDSSLSNFKNTEKLKTQFLKQELALRNQLKKDKVALEDEEFALEVQKIAQNYAVRGQVILDNERLTFDQRRELLAELNEQEAIDYQVQQDKLTALKEQGELDRISIADRAKEAEKRLQLDVFKNAANLLAAITGEQKIAAIAGIAVQTANALQANTVATASAATLAFASQLIPGDPTSVARAYAAEAAAFSLGGINAGLITANGIASGVSTLKGGGSSGGSSGGGYSGGFSSSGSSSIAPVTPSQSAQRVFNIELPESGFVAVDTVSDILKSLAENNEDMQIAISKGQKQAQRVGAI